MSDQPNALFDKEGFLLNLTIWNERIAQQIADTHDITLTENHFEIIHLLRAFYQQHQIAPSTRPLVKLVKNQFGEIKGNSIYIMQLFPASPAKIAAKISGLPKPPNCI